MRRMYSKQYSRRQGLAIGVVFKSLKIVYRTEARNPKRVTRARSARKESIIIEQMVSSI